MMYSEFLALMGATEREWVKVHSSDGEVREWSVTQLQPWSEAKHGAWHGERPGKK